VAEHLLGCALDHLVRELASAPGTSGLPVTGRRGALQALGGCAVAGLQTEIDDLPWSRHWGQARHILKVLEVRLE
jgi:hypothetical protein